MNRSQFLKTLFGCFAAAAVPFKAKAAHRVRTLPVVWRMPNGWPPPRVTLEFYPSDYARAVYKHDALCARIWRWQERQALLDSAKILKG